ncbi:MAG: excinuclease ABC subunit UvrB [bacterium]
MMKFKLISPYEPAGDQAPAIAELAGGVRENRDYQVLLGITGSGKTFTIANVIENLGRQTLILSHNKTLAAQLYGELKTLFPNNAVEYFISYYDYYQPEAYLADRDVFIEKEATVNKEIEKMRLRTTASLFSRDDVIVVSSVSSIYTLGSPDEFEKSIFNIEKNTVIPMDGFIEKLLMMQYERNDVEFERGKFRVRGDTVDIFPAYLEKAYRIMFFDNEIEDIRVLDYHNNSLGDSIDNLILYPASHFVTSASKIERAVLDIERELRERVRELKEQGKELESERLLSRTGYDLELMREIGFCPGIENYSRHIDRRAPGQRPYTLLDYFRDDFLTVIDESHVTIPQIRGMYNGDRSRKQTLVDYGFRLPSALDNRPLRLHEFEKVTGSKICMSATPSDYEVEKAGEITRMIIRPTGLVDPEVIVRPAENQVDNLENEIRKTIERDERVLVTTLTKKMAESLTDYLKKRKFNVRYMHSDIDAIERVDIIRGLRLREFDILVGINLLREGLDLPEVSLVAILDADREGFLRSETSLIQTIGRASRNVNGRVILYGDKMTGSMERAIDITMRRREKQIAYNKEHSITPRTIEKSRDDVLIITEVASRKKKEKLNIDTDSMTNIEKLQLINTLTSKMHERAAELEFEDAALIRDEIKRIKREIKKNNEVKGKR